MQIDDETQLVITPVHHKHEQGVATSFMVLLNDGEGEEHAWILESQAFGALMHGMTVTLPHAQRQPTIMTPSADAVKKVMEGKQ